jgi:prepilin-type N-terminal cleavage/methylation domain-containing protein
MRNKGFTIIELLVVILIMGLLAGISIFSYRSLFARSRMEEAMNEVNAFYAGVNRKAVTQGYRYTIQMDRVNDLLKYISSDGLKQDSLVFRDGLDLDFSGGVGSVQLTVYVDGFVRDEDGIRNFTLLDTVSGESASFYISPLGVLEARLQ